MIKRLLLALTACFILCLFSANAETGAVLVLPAAIVEIEESAFEGIAAEHIVIPDGAVSIGSRAFANCRNLAWLEIPESVIHIAKDAFEGSDQLCILCPEGSTAAFCAELAGIPWQDPHAGEDIPVESITLDAAVLTLNVGESAVLHAQVLPENATNYGLIWTSSAPDIVAAEGGSLRALAPGMAVITAAAEDGGAAASCKVQVLPQEGAIAFSGLNSGASSTNAYMYIKAASQSSGKFTAMGLRMWNDQGVLVVDYEKELTGAARTSLSVWFDVFADSGLVLQPETSYTCQMYVVFAGETCWTGFSTVTTQPAFAVEKVPDNDAIIANLQNCNDKSVLSSSKKAAMVTMAEALLDAGYDPAFVAGVLANIYYEGTFGKFESSKYSSNEPAYLVYMDENYDYRNKYSSKLIYDGISLSEVSAMLDELAAAGYPGKFGLGSVQWTGGRTRNLVALYIEEAGESDTITLEQVITAEVRMIKKELEGSYKYICTRWKDAYADKLNTDDAAFSAGYRVCVSYEVPATYRSKAVTRGIKAMDVYKVMMGL